jgi:hypothetical protein
VAVDGVKLKDCDGGCDLVKYCSDECRKNHRKQHEEDCKKRCAALRDRDLFEQPDEGHLGECPICCLPQPLVENKSIIMSCCSKSICDGCSYANIKREVLAGLEGRCVFCREPGPKSQEEINKRRMNRIKKNCPVAMREMGKGCRIEGDYDNAFVYFTKAAELGDAAAHYQLSFMHQNGDGVEKDEKKQVYHLEKAAIGGHPRARFNLGCNDFENDRFERAKKHLIINANLGHDRSLECVKDLYAKGHASKEDYAGALRAYQAAVDAAKSPEREVAEAYFKQVAGREE